MKIIKTISEQIKEELHGAKEYAKLAALHKSDMPTLAKVYYDMAMQEAQHADMMHTEVVKLIEKQRTIETPPKVMLELWEEEHKEYVELAAHVKYMLSMFSR